VTAPSIEDVAELAKDLRETTRGHVLPPVTVMARGDDGMLVAVADNNSWQAASEQIAGIIGFAADHAFLVLEALVRHVESVEAQVAYDLSGRLPRDDPESKRALLVYGASRGDQHTITELELVWGVDDAGQLRWDTPTISLLEAPFHRVPARALARAFSLKPMTSPNSPGLVVRFLRSAGHLVMTEKDLPT
jgi:predicted NAD/FAD-binding protein